MKKFAMMLVSLAMIAAFAAGCGNKETENKPAAATETAQTTNSEEPAAATVDSPTGTARMIATAADLKTQLDASDETKVKEVIVKLEQDWLSFESDIKTKYPDLYVKVEKFLNPLIAGGKQEKPDLTVIRTLSEGLEPVLQEMSETLKSGDGAVNDKALTESKEIQAATKEYVKYVDEQGTLMVSELEALLKEIKGGDLKKAQGQYVKARSPYERIEPVIELFKELDGVMDARVDDFASEDDENFTGYHRIENILFVKKETAGAVKFAERLLDDSKKMEQSIKSMTIDPVLFVTGVGELMEEAQSTKITGEEERWSQATIPVLRANVEGAQKIFDLLRAELHKKDAALEEKIDKNLQKVLKQMDELSPNVPGTWTPFETIKQEQQMDLKNKLEALATPIVKLPATLSE